MLKTFTIAIAGAALVSAPAYASTTTETNSVTVSFKDLDLSSDEGRNELDRRIENAAKEACGLNEHEVGTRIASREARRCVQDAQHNLEEHFANLISDHQRGG